MQSIKYTALSDENLVRLAIREIENNQLPKSLLLNADIYINGSQLPCEQWEEKNVIQGDHVEIICNVHAIVTIAAATVTALAAVATPIIALGAISYGLNYGVNWAVNKLFPPDEAPDTAVFTTLVDIDGANNPYRPLEALPCVIGTRRVVPDQLLNFYTVVSDNNLEVRHLFCVSAGDVEVWDIRKENTPVSQLNGIEYYIHRDWRGEPLKWFDKQINRTAENHKMNTAFVRETQDNVEDINVIINFPYGLYTTYILDGSTRYVNVNTTYTFRNVYTDEVTTFNRSYSEQKTQTLRKMESFSLPVGKWAMTITANANGGDWYLEDVINSKVNDYQIFMDMYVVETQFITEKKALQYTGQSMTLIEMKATASDSLSGALNSINCMAAMYGKKADGTLVKSNNPALQIRRLLTDPNLIMGTEDVYINDESFEAFEAHCDKYGFSGSGYIQDGRSVGSVCSKLCEIGQGFLTNLGGEYFIFYDDPNAERVDTLTARNSWQTSITTAKPIKPIDGYHMVFNNKDKDYQEDERVVYENGVTPKNIMPLTHEFIDSADGAYKYAILEIARAKTRGKIIKTSTDWRSIDYKLGQKVLFQHGSFYYGIGTAGKVVEHIVDENGFIEAIRLDQYYSLSTGVQYAIQDTTKYSQRFWEVNVFEDVNTNILRFNVPFDVDNAPKFGKIVSVGKTSQVGLYCLIRSITRNADYSATIEMIPAGENFYSSISGTIPPFTSSITTPTQYDRIKPYAPIILQVVADETTATKDKSGNIVLNAKVSMQYVEKEGMQFSYYYITYIDSNGNRQEMTAQTKDFFVIPSVKQGEEYTINVRVVTTANKESEVSTVVTDVVGLMTPPPPPTELSLNGTLLEIELLNRPIDFAGFEVRMAYDVNDVYNKSVQITKPYTPNDSFDLSNFIGSYRRVFVQTVDLLGNKSDYKSIAIGLGDVLDYNVIDDISESAKSWTGSITGGEIVENNLVSKDNIENFYNGVDEVEFYDGTNEVDYFGFDDSQKVIYEFDTDIISYFYGLRFTVEADVSLGEIESVQYQVRKEILTDFYNGTDEVDFYNGTDEVDFFNSEFSEFRLLSSGYTIEEGVSTIRTRVTFRSGLGTLCEDIRSIVDVPDKPTMNFIGVLVEEQGKLIEVPTNYFRKIKNVAINMRYDTDYADYDALSGRTLNKGTIEQGYVIDGVKIACYDKYGELNKGYCDVAIQGY